METGARMLSRPLALDNGDRRQLFLCQAAILHVTQNRDRETRRRSRYAIRLLELGLEQRWKYGTAETPEARHEADEQLARFYVALGALPDKFREAFTARAVENLSLEEASERLGVPVSTVSYRTRRAEQMLCEALGIVPEEGS